MSGLLPHHQRLIKESAIDARVAAERGYWSATKPKELERLFGETQRRLVPALVIPTYNVQGEQVFCQLRPDEPRVVAGKTRKYELAAKARMAIDVPPSVRGVLGNPEVPLVVTEGCRKADSAVTAGLYAVDLVGVWNWRGRNEDDGLTALADWECVALNDRDVYLIFDSDAWTNINVHKALKRFRGFLAQRGGRVRCVYLPSGEGGAKVGLDDFLAAGHTRDDVLALASDQLRPLASDTGQTPAPKSDARLRPTAELITDIAQLVDRYVVLPSRAAALALALYVLHTWASKAAHATPYLAVMSATKRSGKTRLEEILELLVRTPWRVNAPSEAALFRKIESECPTLLLDEVDALFGPSADRTDPIRGILNAGNRPGASVPRVVGEGAAMTVVDFSVYCPKVLAGINTSRWPDTVVDRSISISLRRKKPGETVERFRPRKLAGEVEQLRAECARWAAEYMDALRDADPDPPDGLDDRAVEAWEPLLAIAQLADRDGGEELASCAAHAALKLAGERTEDDAHGIMALTAIHALFAAHTDPEALTSETIAAALNADESLPFGGYRKSAGLDQRGLARLLKPFLIKPRVVRIGSDTPRGYRRDQFVDAWERYCPEKGGGERATPHFGDSYVQQAQHPNNHGRFGPFPDVQQTPFVADSETGENPDEHWDVADVAHRNAQTGGAHTPGPLNGALDAPACSCSQPGLSKDDVCLNCGGFRKSNGRDEHGEELGREAVRRFYRGAD